MSAEQLVPIELHLTITLQSALHIGTGLGLGHILDDRTAWGPHPALPKSQLPYIPGSSLKGRLRFHMRELSRTLVWTIQQRSEVEADLFGFPEVPGLLVFDDAYLMLDTSMLANYSEQQQVALLKEMTLTERSFVSISRGRRVALEQRLFRIELAEHGWSFATLIHGFLPGPEVRATRDLALLIAAARDLTHLGGHKGRGLGACKVAIGPVTLSSTMRTWQELLEVLT